MATHEPRAVWLDNARTSERQCKEEKKKQRNVAQHPRKPTLASLKQDEGERPDVPKSLSAYRREEMRRGEGSRPSQSWRTDSWHPPLFIIIFFVVLWTHLLELLVPSPGHLLPPAPSAAAASGPVFRVFRFRHWKTSSAFFCLLLASFSRTLPNPFPSNRYFD